MSPFLRIIVSLSAALLAFVGMAVLVDVSSPWLSTAQVLFLAGLCALLVFLTILVTPDFLAPCAPIGRRIGGRAIHPTLPRRTRLNTHPGDHPKRTMHRQARTMVSILWGAIRVEITPIAPVLAM